MDAISPEMPPSERAELAARLGLNEQYLYQCLSGRRQMKAVEAARVERETGGRIRRWHLRQNDWRDTWPELASDPNAPIATEAA